MIDRLEAYRVYRATIPLSFLQISDLCTIPTRFSDSLNEENQMCEARFPNLINSQIQSNCMEQISPYLLYTDL